MRLIRMVIATALLVSGLELAIVRTEAHAASDCPCKQVGNSCIPDAECEALRRSEQRGRLRELRKRAYKNGAERTGRAADAPPAPPPPVVRAPIPRSAPLSPDNAGAPDGSAAPAPKPAPAADGRPPAAADGRPPAAADGRRPAAANGRPPAAANGGSPASAGPARVGRSGGRPRILETGYSHLTEFGKETPGYGLYSYAILPSGSDRAARFLAEVFREVPAIGDTSAKPSQLNIFYVPLRKEKEGDLTTMRETLGPDATKRGAEYARSFYDYRMARGLLNHICNPPDASVLDLCNGDLSRGPYIFTYASPASHIEPVPPPYLFVDLSDVHERAFGEFLAAFQAQVKREDITDQARIKTLRLGILNIALTAADWVPGVQKAVADITRIAQGGDDKKQPAQ